MENSIIILHDNGDKTRKGWRECGYTEYTAEEFNRLFNGSVDTLLKEYASHSITVYRIDF